MRLVTFRDPHGIPRAGRLEGKDEVVELEAESLLAWLDGDGRRDTATAHPLVDVSLLAPLPRPPSIRDFFAFEGHVATGWKLRGGEIPPAWYEQPVFYFSNPASVHAPGQPVRRPAACEWLDFELEVAAAIDLHGEIAGFMLMNDWSARDVQRREMTVGLGPAKGKDFATSLGPWLVTPDELPYDGERLDLTAQVTVNGGVVTTSEAREQHWTWPQLVEHAARDTVLVAGDVLGSGTFNRGCELELGGTWIQPGDVVTLAAPGLGELSNPVV